MARNGRLEKITERQARAIAALLASRDIKTAAVMAQVGERTLYRWMDSEPFRAALLAAEGDAIDQAARRLVGLQDGAVNVLAATMDDAAAAPAVRLRAAQAVLDYLLKLRELRNIEERLTALETERTERSKRHEGNRTAN